MSMGAMLDMMQRMMGNNPGEGQGQGQGQGAGEQGGEGQTGDSNSPNGGLGEGGDGLTEERRVPKNAGRAGTDLPQEFRKALDAYNKKR